MYLLLSIQLENACMSETGGRNKGGWGRGVGFGNLILQPFGCVRPRPPLWFFALTSKNLSATQTWKSGLFPTFCCGCLYEEKCCPLAGIIFNRYITGYLKTEIHNTECLKIECPQTQCLKTECSETQCLKTECSETQCFKTECSETQCLKTECSET